MNKKLIWLVPIFGVLGAVLFGILNEGGKVAPEASQLKAARGSDGTTFCMGRQKCLVAFVAPWCGYCRRSTPLMQSLLQKYKPSGDLVFNVVVTGDETASIEGYASELGGGAFYDPQNQFASAMGVRGFPTWVLFDASGKPIKTASGAFPTSEQLFSHMGITGS